MKKIGKPKGIETKGSAKKDYGLLGNLIRKGRIGLKLSLGDVANALGCSIGHICNLEHGRSPISWEKIPILANLLNLPIEELEAANLLVRDEFKNLTRKNVGTKAIQAMAILLKNEELQEFLIQFEPVFTSWNDGEALLSADQIQYIVKKAALRAGITKPVSPHWLRHAHASHALDRGAPIHLVQSTLGHASVATTGRYLHSRPSEISGKFLGI